MRIRMKSEPNPGAIGNTLILTHATPLVALLALLGELLGRLLATPGSSLLSPDDLRDFFGSLLQVFGRLDDRFSLKRILFLRTGLGFRV